MSDYDAMLAEHTRQINEERRLAEADAQEAAIPPLCPDGEHRFTIEVCERCYLGEDDVSERVYALKWLDAEGRSPQQKHPWPLPKGSRPGKWVVATGDLEVCVNGIHATKLDAGTLEWINERCFVIELDGATYHEGERKWVARRGRLVRETAWDGRTARLFAADCAAKVLPIYEKSYPDDDRPRKAIAAARRYARNPSEANRAKMAAAGDAAWAAGDAAGDAAGAAAGAAAGDAAWAARDAAWAARDAAWAARGAAGDAAWAARDAARAAARAAQAKRLGHYLEAPEEVTP